MSLRPSLTGSGPLASGGGPDASRLTWVKAQDRRLLTTATACYAWCAEHCPGAEPVVVLGVEAHAGTACALSTGTKPGIAGGDDLIPVCRPWAWAATPYSCPVDEAKVAITPSLPILTMPQYCAVGSTGAAALRTAVRRAREIGGGGLVAASPGALGTADGDTAKSSTERRPGSVRPTQVGAP